MAYKYPNFAAEMARTGTDYENVYAVTAEAINKSTDTISNWITGRAGELPVTAAFVIKDRFFPTMTVDYLFSTEPKNNVVN